MTLNSPTEAVRESTQPTQKTLTADRLQCPSCGYSPIRREERKGFLQMRIYSLFGYYPWICVACKKTSFVRKRFERRRKRSNSTD